MISQGSRSDRGPDGPPVEVGVTWEGDLDVASAPVLASAVRVLDELGVGSVALDVSAVSFMDCAGLGAVIDADTRLHGGVRLLRPSRAVLRLLSLVGLSDRFATADGTGATTVVPGTLTTVEQSLGLVMGSFGCSADQAWQLLRDAARRHNVQVRVLAALLATVASADRGGSPAGVVRRVMGAARAPA